MIKSLLDTVNTTLAKAGIDSPFGKWVIVAGVAVLVIVFVF